MQTYTFTVDDNVRFLKELTLDSYQNLFDHPYLAMYKRLHARFGLKVQLNLFYSMEDFTLAQMTDAFKAQWRENSHWLKLSFHSYLENEYPYATSDYDEVAAHCALVHDQILRFAGVESLAKTTTLHYCAATEEGVRALHDHGVEGLPGLFGSEEEPTCSYSLPEEICAKIRSGTVCKKDGMAFAPIDVVLNCFSKEENLQKVQNLLHRDHLWLMIHEQYFYEDYFMYQPDFEEKLTAVFSLLAERTFESKFFEELL